MLSTSTHCLTGFSGRSYEFGVYPLGNSFAPLGAVYCISKKATGDDDKGAHSVLYIGQTGDLSTLLDAHRKRDCFENNGATSICLHIELNKALRLEIERDLINALRPPCND